jgi:hypothetical protein
MIFRFWPSTSRPVEEATVRGRNSSLLRIPSSVLPSLSLDLNQFKEAVTLHSAKKMRKCFADFCADSISSLE